MSEKIDNTNYSGPDHLMDMAKIGVEETYPESERFASGNLVDDDGASEEWAEQFYIDIPSECDLDTVLSAENGSPDNE